jgi:DNA-binding transcriptional ArsR family regulator
MTITAQAPASATGAENARKGALPDNLQETYRFVMSLLGEHAPEEMPPKNLSELAEERGLAPRTVREHLRRLEELGYIRRQQAGRRGLVLSAVRQPNPGHTAAESREIRPNGRTLSIEGASVSERVSKTERQKRSDKKDLLLSMRLLTDAGVYPQLARELARLPWVTPDLVEAWIVELKSRSAVRKVPAVLVRTLRRRDRCLPVPPRRQAAPEQLTDKAEGTPQAAAEAAIEADPAPFNNGLGDLPWREVLVRFSERLGPRAEALGMPRAAALALSDGVLIIGVPSALAADWLMTRMQKLARETVQEVTGRELGVRFVPGGLNMGLEQQELT